MLLRHWKTALATALCAAAFSQPGPSQAPPATILVIDYENQVVYVEDVADPQKFATDPGVTTVNRPRNFYQQVVIADIKAVNGQPAHGTYVLRAQIFNLRSSPNPGEAIADISNSFSTISTWQILKPDGTQIGTIMGVGYAGTTGANSPPPPGTPLAVTSSNVAIVGGTGAFFGARGMSGLGVTSAPARQASITEDPSNRRGTTGGKAQSVIYLIPMERPEITVTANGPAVAHSSDFALVTASKPAAAGEILSLIATGLGPTVPGVNPGEPFPVSPLAVVNSPVEVKVNGKSAEVLGAVGYPGAVNSYQVNFRVPPDAASGPATIQVTAAWITGSGVRVPVQ